VKLYGTTTQSYLGRCAPVLKHGAEPPSSQGARGRLPASGREPRRRSGPLRSLRGVALRPDRRASIRPNREAWTSLPAGSRRRAMRLASAANRVIRVITWRKWFAYPTDEVSLRPMASTPMATGAHKVLSETASPRGGERKVFPAARSLDDYSSAAVASAAAFVKGKTVLNSGDRSGPRGQLARIGSLGRQMVRPGLLGARPAPAKKRPLTARALPRGGPQAFGKST